jgi:hypothetical protein
MYLVDMAASPCPQTGSRCAAGQRGNASCPGGVVGMREPGMLNDGFHRGTRPVQDDRHADEAAHCSHDIESSRPGTVRAAAPRQRASDAHSARGCVRTAGPATLTLMGSLVTLFSQPRAWLCAGLRPLELGRNPGRLIEAGLHPAVLEPAPVRRSGSRLASRPGQDRRCSAGLPSNRTH